jgi:hypothetical protein
MAFVSKDLSVLSYANGFTLWHYTTADAAAVVDSAGYFNDASHMLRAGDILVANVDTDGTPGAQPAPSGRSESQLRRMMQDPRYWRDHDTSFAAEVRRGFEDLYPEEG